jgi:predicted metal-dependent hydrolase|nr:MAG: hypothetical protein KatS3mg041_1120 [Bacteroidota bacterium]
MIDELWERGRLCFLEGAFYEAHEAWEEAWRSAPEAERELWKGWTQLAAGCHHLKKGNLRGAYTLLRRSYERLLLSPAHFRGIRMQALLADLKELLQYLDAFQRA